jgi:hypothetical protein
LEEVETRVACAENTKAQVENSGVKFPGGFMASERFEDKRKRVFRKHKHSIVRSALNGYKRKGRGLVLVELTDAGGMGHLSYVTLDTIKHRQIKARLNDRDYKVMLIEKISTYYPSSEILVVVTDGKYERFSLGSRQAR